MVESDHFNHLLSEKFFEFTNCLIRRDDYMCLGGMKRFMMFHNRQN